MSNFSILFEDDQLLVIDKPAHVVVNRAESVKGETVQDWVSQVILIPTDLGGGSLPAQAGRRDSSASPQNDTISKNFHDRAGIVHRLDKETSGCLIIAKNPESFATLQAAFKEHVVQKKYVALVHGKLVPQEGEIRAPVGRLPWNSQRFGVVPGGKEAVTKYKRIMIYDLRLNNKKETLNLLELYPESGRTHQLRVHLKYIGHPIVGDYLYAGRKLQREDRKWCPRVFLHAASIEFPHPLEKINIKVEAPLPQELVQVLKKLAMVS